MARRPCQRNNGSALIDTDGVSAVKRAIPPRQPGTVRTTRRVPIMATAAAPTCSADSIRPPECTSAFARPDGTIASTICVATPSGQSACTRTRRGVSALTDIDNDTTAAFVAAYTLSPGTGPCPDNDAMFTMSPPLSPNAPSAARVPQIVPSRFTSTSCETEPDDNSLTVPSWPTPALLNQTAHGPCSRAVSATTWCAASSRTSCAVWFNNAGVGHDGTVSELSSGSVSQLVEVNLLGTIWGTRAALGAFGDSGGDIVNIASLSGHGPVPGLSVYAATKAAVVSLSMSVNAETPRRVRVHALCPDGVATQMVDAMVPSGRAKALVHSGGRMLSAEQVGAAAVAMIGTRRVVRTVPGWRGGMARFTALTPSVSMRAEPLLRWQGRRAIRRSSSSRPG